MTTNKTAPKVGQIYQDTGSDPDFSYTVIVVDVTPMHVWYRFVYPNDNDVNPFKWSYPCVHEVWNASASERRLTGETQDADLLQHRPHY